MFASATTTMGTSWVYNRYSTLLIRRRVLACLSGRVASPLKRKGEFSIVPHYYLPLKPFVTYKRIDDFLSF